MGRSYKPGEAPKAIFNVRGMNVTRAVKMEDGSYDLIGRELQLYLDPITNEVLHTWHNPYNNKDVTGSLFIPPPHDNDIITPGCSDPRCQ